MLWFHVRLSVTFVWALYVSGLFPMVRYGECVHWVFRILVLVMCVLWPGADLCAALFL